MPLAGRLERGEGFLWLANLLVLCRRPVFEAWRAALSVALLAVLYAFNDFYDAAGDLRNPRKDPILAALFLEGRGIWRRRLAAAQAILTASAFWVGGWRDGSVVAGLFAVNAAYSLWLKGVPGLDVAAAALWGFLFAEIVRPALGAACLIAAGVAVCHCFQCSVDRRCDRINGIRTSAVASPIWSVASLCASGAALSALLFFQFGWPAALSAAVPFFAGFLFDDPWVAWNLSRVYFGLVFWFRVTAHAAA